MIRFIQEGCKQLSPCLSEVSHQYWTHFQFYQRHLWFNFSKLWKIASIWYSFIQAGCKQLSPCLSGVSHQYCTHFQFHQRHLSLNFLKFLIDCLDWLSRWYRFIQSGCKQLSPCLSRVSHQYCTHFQLYKRHLWLNF